MKKLNKKLKLRYIASASIALVLMCLITSIVLGASWGYDTEISVADGSGTARTGLVAIVDEVEADNLIAAGFVNQYCSDVDLQEGTTSRDFMPRDTSLMMYIPALSAYQEKDFDFYMDYDPAQTSFPIILGEDGYITTTDSSVMELGDDFYVEFQAYLDSSPTWGPVVEAVASSTEDTEVSTHDMDLPSGIEEGDLLLMIVSVTDPDGGGPTITAPAEWTELHSHGDTTCDVLWAYKIAEGDEGSSTTFSTGSDTSYSAHQTFRITHYTGIPVELSYGTTDTTPNPPSLDSLFTLEYDQNVLWIAAFGGDTTADFSCSAYPTNYDDDQRFTKSDSSGRWAGVGSATRTTQTTVENPGEFTISQNLDGEAITIAIEGDIPSVLNKEDSLILYFDQDNDLHAEFPDCPVTTYFYTEGVENVAWDVGYSTGADASTQSKESDHLYLFAQDTGAASAQRTYVTSSTIDMSIYSTLYFDCLFTASGTYGYERINLTVDEVKMESASVYDEEYENWSSFGRALRTVNVGSDTGNKYIRLHASEVETSPDTDSALVRVYNVYGTGSQSFSLEASDLTTGIHKVKLYTDSGTLKLDIDDVTEDSDSDWGDGYTVVNNGNSWIFSMPYADYIKVKPDGESGAYYQPSAFIDGTVMPDIWAPTANDGVITWGTESDSLTVTIGATTVFEDLVSGATTEIGSGGGIVPNPQSPTDWYPTGNGTGLPFFDMMQYIPGQFNTIAQDIGMPTASLYFMIIVAVAVAVGFGVMLFTNSVLLSAIMTGIVLAAAVSTGIVGSWMLFVFIIIAVGTLYLARSS